jgi:HSP20 family protein
VGIEMPGVSKENIKVNIYDNSVEVSTIESSPRRYHEVVKLPEEVNVETAKSTYNNGILEIIFKKKQEPKPKGKQIRID